MFWISEEHGRVHTWRSILGGDNSYIRIVRAVGFYRDVLGFKMLSRELHRDLRVEILKLVSM